ncbi:hypothetical protein Taro_034108 [Colocasia esculenta]|uniref:Uncharacterized protein n=1 Tax=Colocasia esculenta TaxID=4460 RepID=A0A843W6M1_COLES|nr:hypothetical protein [Colocasia esculenta]
MPPTGSAPKPKAEEDVPPKRAGKRRVADSASSGDDETYEERCRSDCFGQPCLFAWRSSSPLWSGA